MDEQDEFDRPNVRWENDFGPDKAMWVRYLMAAGVALGVIAFLTFAIMMGREREVQRGVEAPETWSWFILVPLMALIVLISLKGAAVAIRIKAMFVKPPTDD